MYKLLESDFYFEDERGYLNQLIHKGFKQVNVLFSKKGVIRGNHYHKHTKEAFFVVEGAVEVTFKKGNKEEKRIFEKGSFFLIESLTEHIMHFLFDCLMIQLYSRSIENKKGKKDIVYSES